MKHLLTCFAILLAFLSACKKDDSFKSNVDLERFAFLPDSFLCTATKEVPGLGKIPWTANCAARLLPNEKFQIEFTTISDLDDQYLRESFTFLNISQRSGLYQVFDSESFQKNENLAYCSYSRTLSDGDVYDARWTCDLSKSNEFKVEEIDLVNKIVKGSFNIHLEKKNPGNSGVMYSDYINFKNGQFTARIKD